MKNIIFLGYVVSPDEADQMSGASVAGNKMQWNVLHYLQARPDIQLHGVTVTPLAVFPREKQKRQKRQRVMLDCGVDTVRVAYWNLPILKQLNQILNVCRETEKLIKETGADTIFCFNLFPQIGIPMRWLRHRFSHLDTVCLLADLPIDNEPERKKGLFAWLRSLYETSTWKSIACCDQFITLNEYVARQYLNGRPYLVIDGGVDDSMIEKYQVSVPHSKDKNILFCGALTDYNGIMPMIEAMKMIPAPEIYLDIYGTGDLEQSVQMAAQQDRRIRFYGRVANTQVLHKQREAWLLVNPRKVDDPISWVTFPSKTFEYLLSGTPVLTTPLDTYGPEYADKMYFTKDDSAQALADAIQEIYAKPAQELQAMARRAAQFVVEQKTWSSQCVKIDEFLQNNRKGQKLNDESCS